MKLSSRTMFVLCMLSAGCSNPTAVCPSETNFRVMTGLYKGEFERRSLEAGARNGDLGALRDLEIYYGSALNDPQSEVLLAEFAIARSPNILPMEEAKTVIRQSSNPQFVLPLIEILKSKAESGDVEARKLLMEHYEGKK